MRARGSTFLGRGARSGTGGTSPETAPPAPALVLVPSTRRSRRRARRRDLTGWALRAGAQLVAPTDAAGRRIGPTPGARSVLAAAVVGGRRSVWSISSMWSVGSVLSVASGGSAASLASAGSVLSIGSAGSILSIGSAGSVLSIGSLGSVGAIGGIGRRLGGPSSRVVGGAATALAVTALASGARSR